MIPTSKQVLVAEVEQDQMINQVVLPVEQTMVAPVVVDIQPHQLLLG
jgi:hypothetical protein